MAYVIGEKCLGERYADCVEVCPVDCIYPGEYEGEEFMVIDPDLCIDCTLCKPACPIDAIFETEAESPDWQRSMPSSPLSGRTTRRPRSVPATIRRANRATRSSIPRSPC